MRLVTDQKKPGPAKQTPADRWAKLIVREPGLDPVSVFLDGPEITLGRGEESRARLHSPYVSRQHVLIAARGEGHILQCLEASNGTSVNGRPVSGELLLSHGDEIRLADVSVWYIIEVPPDVPTPPLPEREAAATVYSGLYISLDEERHRVWLADRDEEVPLAPNEFRLLGYLAARPGRVAAREELIMAVWGENDYDVDSLYRLVQRVKEKIEPDPATPRYLISHRGLGYSLEVNAPERPLDGPD